jgi:hypothetical protein
MPDDQQDRAEAPTDRTDKEEEPDASPSSDDEHRRDYAAEATDPSGDVASGGGEQPA